jgi:PAS domain S-box-containing protein
MVPWLPVAWSQPLRTFWRQNWRGLLLCALFAVITAASVQNARSTRTALGHFTPADGADAWQLSAKMLHGYADELVQIAISVDRERRPQAESRIKKIMLYSQNEIYRLHDAAQMADGKRVLNLEAMRHLYFRAQDEALNLIELPTTAAPERKALQLTMLMRAVGEIHSTLGNSREARRAARTQQQAAAVQSSLDQANWTWPTWLGLAGLIASVCGVAVDWQALRNREEPSSHADAEYVRDLAVDGPALMLALDLAGTCRWINVAGAGLLHTSREAAIGTSFLKFVAEGERVSDLLARLQRGESLTAYPLTLRARDGVAVSVLLDATACLKRGYFTHVRCVLQDVTGRLQMEEAYRASERRLKAVVDHSPTGVFLTNVEGDCTFVNQKWCEQAGMTPERAAGQGWADALHPDDRERVFTEWYRCAKSGEDYHLECRFRKPDGTTTWVDARAVPLRDEAGQITQYLGNVTDITQLKHVEQSLVRQRLHLRAILDTANDGIVVIDDLGIIESANPTVQRLFGCTAEELLGENVSRWMPAFRDNHDGHMQRFLAAGGRHLTGSERREVIGVRKDGSEFPLELSVSAMQSGSTVRFTGILHDISERKTAEARLRQSEERFELAVRGSNDVVWDWNLETDDVYFAPRFAELLGFELAEMQPHNSWLLELLHPEDRAQTKAELDAHFATDAPYSIEHRVQTKAGDYRWFHSRGRAVRDEQGRPIRMVGTTSDITVQKLHEEEVLRYAADVEDARSRIELQAAELARQTEMLQQANESAQAASLAKGRFLANMSHEIRTPLNAILGMTQLALDGELADEQRELLDTVHSSGEHLLSLINDILDFSKIEAGKLELEVAPFAVRDGLRCVLEMFARNAEGKGLTLRVDVAESVPHTLIGDEGRLRQILVNLVGNAIKFTAQGEVAVSVQPATDDGTTPRWRFTVRDTGIGIPADKLDTIFHPFEQADSSTTRKFGGTGLGLSIVTSLVEMMQGRAWVESELGQGSRFHFEVELPIATEDAAAVGSPHAVAGDRDGSTRPLHVLVAEDNVVNQRLVRMLLQKQGHRVTLVDDGAAAVEAAAMQSFDLILMDMQMPTLSGLEATVAIRRAELEAHARPVPIIALTANAMQGDRDDCLAAGMNGYVAKPIRREELFGEIHRVVSAQPACRPGVNLTAVLDRFDQSHELLAELVGLYAGSTPELVAQLKAAAAADRLDEVAGLVHQLKGSTGLFGRSAALETVLALERTARQSSPTCDRDAVDQLERETTELVQQLQSQLAAFTREVEVPA